MDTSRRRYNSFSAELKRLFGCKVQRISIDAGFTCPNRDGTAGTGGCIFCGERGAGSYSIRRNLSIAGQLEDGREIMVRKYRAEKFLAYFQSFTTTHCRPETLHPLFDEALAVPDVVGLMVSTRPDCLPDETVGLLAEYSRKTYLWLEIGMQSMHDRSLTFLNRCHDHAASIDAVIRAKSAGLRVCAHVIVGIPGEGRCGVMATVGELNRLKVDGVKIHLFHVLKGTRLAEMYSRGEVSLPDRDGYAGLVCDAIEHLSPGILIHRLTGDGGRHDLVAPLWSLKKFETLNLIEHELERRGGFQGKYADYPDHGEKFLFDG